PGDSSSKSSPPEEPPFFTPATTAPTNQGCVTTIQYKCYSPQYIQQALGLTPLYRTGLDGRNQQIVLLGAGRATTIQADLHQFNLAWGLPDTTLTVLHPDGEQTTDACPNADRLQYDTIRNVEWTHAIAPGAKIVLLIGSNMGSQTQPEENCV